MLIGCCGCGGGAQAPWLLDLMPAAALQHVVAQAPWTLLGAQPSQLAALNESHAAASTAVATDPYAAEPAQTPAGGEAGGGQAVPWKGGLPPGFGGQWSRLTLHVDQVVLPSPGAAAELRPKAYKYYATYMLPGVWGARQARVACSRSQFKLWIAIAIALQSLGVKAQCSQR